MFKIINQFVTQNQLIKPEQIIVVGFSGGPDSIFLLNYLMHVRTQQKLTLIAAHLDHEWRKDSAQDVLFCKQYCEKNNVTFVAGRATDLKIKTPKTGSKEEAGRTLRRAFFQEIKQRYNADSIALAHHLDDQLETFFIRLLRGTTVTGLACMRPKQEGYVRPLLCIKKQEILDYLAHKQISYLTDPTNKSPDFLRNRIRMSLIPVLEQIDTRYFTNIQKVIGSMQETDAFLQQLAQQTLATISPTPQNIDIKKLLALDNFLQKLVITQWLYGANVTFTISSAFIDEILRFFNNKKSNTHEFNQWIITKTRNIATIIKNKTSVHEAP